MKVIIPSSLRSYTQHGEAEASGATLAAVLADLDRAYPGIRFRMVDEQGRIRRHIRIFVNGDQLRDLSQPLRATDEVVIVQALSGG
ncbi:MAG: MoaD/ThiS family protein [Burkholderiales bacterium]